ncbi:MAG: hypothetical protein NC827_00710 [Candidatus Omnitrophica bacterium]|nr:hypothetical protein [Candidatus Omnitrophota bacterium]MCM8801822.1 hypothetical protein [Candidatus Omnitrophota bacterium]
MRKGIIILFYFLSFLVFSDNLILNSDFEKDFNGWKCVRIEKDKQVFSENELSLVSDTPDNSKNSLKVSLNFPENYSYSRWNSGVFGVLKEKIPVDKEKVVNVNFYAKWLSDAEYLSIGRLWGGSEIKIIKLEKEWKNYNVYFKYNYDVNEVIFSPVNNFGKVVSGEFLIDNVSVEAKKIDEIIKSKEPKGISILFCAPQQGYGWIDFTYLKELYQKGFEVDYTESLNEITWDRIKNYNVLVLFQSPGYHYQKEKIEYDSEFKNLIEKYVSEGGGVLLMPTEDNLGRQKLIELTDLFGAKIPVERIVEQDKEKIASLTNSTHATPIAFTDNILPSPVSEGVKHIWYPYQIAYLSQMTAPIIVDENWKVVVRASKTSHTEPIDISKETEVIKNPIIRTEKEKEPVIFAIREYRNGRVALCAQWRQFSIGAGTKWIYDRQVLSKGAKGIESDFGKLLENTFKYLGEVSFKNKKFGGYVTDEQKLLPPNLRPGVKAQFDYYFWVYEPEVLGYRRPQKGNLYKGIIGAKTNYSTGKSTVEEYANKGKQFGFDFIVFADDFEYLTPEKFEELKEDCKKYSDDKIKLFAGFSILNNVGNYMIFYGKNPVFPPDKVLTKDKKRIYIQEEDDKGNFTGYITPYLNWVLANYHNNGNVCYYNFSTNKNCQPMWDLKLYAAVGIRYYKNGKLIEDLTEEYLKTAQCTIAPNPVSINEIYSADELKREIENKNSLTYIMARNLDTIFEDGLRWTHQYDGVNIFSSNGPLIYAWPWCHRVITYGGEEFVTPISVMPSYIDIKSDVGLKEIRIYNGQELFRKIKLDGEKEYIQTLVLDGTVQKNLVLIAEDIKGGKAISFPRRCWKEGALGVSFCSDHVNAYIDGLLPLAHGPYWYPMNRAPVLPVNIAGDTWDGGPPACLPLIRYQDTVPILETDTDKEDGRRFVQMPLLEFSDEGVLVVSSVKEKLYDGKVLNIVNPWHTYGPINDFSKIFNYKQRYIEYVTPTIGVPEAGWAGPGVRVGINVSIFSEEISFLKDDKVKSLQVGYFGAIDPDSIIVICNGEKISEYQFKDIKIGDKFILNKGDWIAFYKKGISNSHIFINRKNPVKIVHKGNLIWFADGVENIKKGEKYIFEICGVGIPVNVEVESKEDILKIVKYIEKPEYMEIKQGKKISSNLGIIELNPENYNVEIYIKKPKEKMNLTLPLMIKNLNKKWTSILWQKKGYSKGDYGKGENRFREPGIDIYGNSYVPLYIDYAEETHILSGHPVIAETEEGKQLFIQVTHVSENPDKWHISVNNPTDKIIKTKIKKVIDLPGMKFKEKELILTPGSYIVLE